MSIALVRYVLTAAIRDRLIITLIVAMLVAISLSIFMGSAAITEKSSFAIVFAAAGVRLAGVLGLVLFAVFFIRRSFDSRDVEFLLSRPISRTEFILSYAAGFSILGLVLGAVQGVCIYMPSPQNFQQTELYWVLSLALENVIMINVALFFSMILTSAATATMATIGFYVLTRLMGQILGIIDAHEAHGYMAQQMEIAMQVISMALPRLDLMAQTSWLIYDEAIGNFDFVIMQGSLFVIVVVLASLIDLVRKQF